VRVARKWWQRKWYFVLPVAVVFGAGVYFATVGKWTIAALYFGLAAFYAVLERRTWQRYGRPNQRD
jgi:hypothetical protein